MTVLCMQVSTRTLSPSRNAVTGYSKTPDGVDGSKDLSSLIFSSPSSTLKAFAPTKDEGRVGGVIPRHALKF